MWLFSYGSLMWDKWMTEQGCVRRELADLPGYCRMFNKASIRNWGTNDAPCPTLNLSKNNSSVCRGIAFEFPDNKKKEVLAKLIEREGKAFVLHEKNVLLRGVTEALAIVPIYQGKHVIDGKEAKEVAYLVAKAMGTHGSCLEYVKKIVEKLNELNINDPVVTEFWEAVKGGA